MLKYQLVKGRKHMGFYEWFFLEKDRQPAGLFSWSQLLSVTLTLAIFIALAVILAKKFKGNKKAQDITIWVAAIAIVALQIAKISYCLVGSDNIADTLIGNAPLYFCDIMIFMIPISAIVRGRARDCSFDFIAVCGLLMGFMGNYFAGNIYGSHAVISFFAINSLLNHSISAFVAIFIFVSGLNKMEKRNIPFVVGILFTFMSIALVMAYVFDKNFMFYFSGDGTPFTLFYDLVKGNLIAYQIIIYVLQCGYIGLFYLIYYPVVKWLRNRKREDVIVKPNKFFWVIKKIFYRVEQKVFKFAMRFMNWDEPEVLKGEGSVLKLPAFVKSKGVNKVLIVTDKGLMSLKLLDPLFEQLKKEKIEYVVYDGVQPNPTIPNIEECKDIYIKNQCEGIIAFGGGSPMDCAKAAAARVVKPKQSVPKMRGYLMVHKKIPPFFAVPTTAGTGSETTLAAVVSDPTTHEKYAIGDPCLRPKYAVLDPVLTIGLPPHITAATGMDALTHAVEAYIGKSNVKSTIRYAEDAVKLIHTNLKKAYDNGKDMEARDNMLYASYLAGNAFTRAFVGYVHAIAHNLGGKYGTPHGLANAVILPHILEWYGSSVYKPLAKLADLIGLSKPNQREEEKAKVYINEIKKMNKEMGIPETFDFIKEEDIPVIVNRAIKEGNPGYPVPKIMNAVECEQVVRSLMSK